MLKPKRMNRGRGVGGGVGVGMGWGKKRGQHPAIDRKVSKYASRSTHTPRTHIKQRYTQGTAKESYRGLHAAKYSG